MKHVRVLKVRKVAPVTVAELLRRLTELQKLREQVRSAEVAMKPGAKTPLTRYH